MIYEKKDIMMVTLQNQISEVAIARQRLEVAKMIRDKALTDWKASNADILQEVDSAFAELSESESQLREMTLEVYAMTGNKKPAEGVSVNIFQVLDYDPKLAYQFALDHKMFLSLDKKSFADYAKRQELDFVRVTTEPRALISQDLTKILNSDLSSVLKGE